MSDSTSDSRVQLLKEQAHRLGFDLVGIAPATEADGFDRYTEWLDRGFAGEMSYLERRREERRHPRSILQTVRSVVMVGMSYAPHQTEPKPGRVAAYAQGPDYHDVLWNKLDQLLAWLQEQIPHCHGRSVVDTAPLLERDFARRAGLGWFGKNTMLLNKSRGSFFFLGALLVDVELPVDRPQETSHCGTCTACLDACPTEAFVAPGTLDARRCISYLTIEHRSEIPTELRSGLGAWIFGCDVCQDVCPWNRKAPRVTPVFPHQVDLETIDPKEIFELDEAEFRRRFRGTAILRTKRRGLLRNAAIVLGNTAGREALPILEKAASDPDPIIREAARWAQEQIECRLHKAACDLAQQG